jgi:large repetitive protein
MIPRTSQIPDKRTRFGIGDLRSRRRSSLLPCLAAVTLCLFPRRASLLAALAALLAVGTTLTAQVSQPPCTPLDGAFCSEPVGFTGGEQNVTVTARVAGVVSEVEVVTAGVSGLDFTPGIGAMTCASATLTVGATCIESVMFTPAKPGLRTGAVVLLDSNANVLGTTFINGTGVGGLGILVAGNLQPVAGDGTSATLNRPSGVVLDGTGNLYIADQGHNRIRVVNAATGVISTLAGNGTAAYAGDGLVASNAAVSLNAPSSVAMDGAGNLYIADTGNNVVRRIDAATGIITNFAGTGAVGSSGDGAAAASATLNQPKGVTVDSSGNLYLADSANHRIRRVDAITGIITNVAGDGTTDPSTGAGGYAGDHGPAAQAELNFPFAVAFDPAGNMYIPDAGNNLVRVVTAVNGLVTGNSIITTYAGTGTPGNSGDGGAAALATMSTPSGVIADAAGNIYVADTGNASIRKVSSASSIISTIAANHVGEYVDSGGGLHPIGIGAPIGLFLDGSGDLYFADAGNMLIEKIESNFAVLDFSNSAVRQGSRSAIETATIENDGNAPLDLTAITQDSNAALAESANPCAVGEPALAVNEDCAIGAEFAPATAGNPIFGHVEVSSDAENSPLEIELIGDAAPVNSTTTTLVSNVNPSGFGQPVVFTATVTTGAAEGTPNGSVTFMDGANALRAPVAVNASGVASFQSSALAVGVHSITASYSGDGTHFSSVSQALAQIVLEATSTTLVSSLNPAAPGQSITLTATVKAIGGGAVTPDGTLTLTDGDATLAILPVNANGIETYTTAALADGPHTITAIYNGDAGRQISASISNLIRQEVLVASRVTIASTPNPSNAGGAIVFSATVTSSASATPTGTVNILDSTTLIGTISLVGPTSSGTFTISSLAIGTHTTTAAYLGDTNNSPSASPAIAQVVKGLATTTTLSATPNPVLHGNPVNLIATVQPENGTAALTGTVTFTDTFNGSAATLGSARLSAAGTAAINPVLAAGAHSIVAAYGGNASQGGSVSAVLVVIVQLPSTATVLSSSSDPSAAESPVTFTVTVTAGNGEPAGNVTFTADGAPIATVALSPNGIATASDFALSPGTHSIAAVYSGDANHAASTALGINQVVELVPTTTTLAANKAVGSSSSLSATVTGSVGPPPTGTVTFMIGTSTLATAQVGAGGVATFAPNLGAGTYVIVASYGGDAWHAASASSSLTVTGASNPFGLTVTPSSLTMATNQASTVTVALASNGFFGDTIALACSQLPAGVSCAFSNPSVSLAPGGTATSQLTVSTSAAVAAAKASSEEGLRFALAGMFLPVSIFFGCVFRRHGGTRSVFFTSALAALLCCSALVAVGCASVRASKAPSAYVIQVTGTGVKSNAVQSQDVTLNIAQ